MGGLMVSIFNRASVASIMVSRGLMLKTFLIYLVVRSVDSDVRVVPDGRKRESAVMISGLI